MPGITGHFGNLAMQAKGFDGEGRSGAFRGFLEGVAGGYGTPDEKAIFDGYTFDAARCNTVYGASETVMPPSVNIPIILYLGIHA